MAIMEGTSGWRAWAAAVTDHRLSRRNRIAAVVTGGFVVWAVVRLGSGNWGNLAGHIALHAWVVAWLMLTTLRTRTIGLREVVRFWVTGLFPVVLVIFLITEPAEALFGIGDFQTGFLVPIVEELIKALPLVVWVVVSFRRQVTPTISDLMLLGFAVGAGFAFHEDALWARLAADGFGEAPWGLLFPTFLYEGIFVVTHSGWTMVAGIGIGVWAVYRDRRWAIAVPLAAFAVVVLDHAAANVRGGLGDILSTIVFDGRLTGWILLLGVPAVVVHDYLMLRWADERDRMFSHPSVRSDLGLLRGGVNPNSVGRFLTRMRYRRARNAAFADLYRVRSLDQSAGDRSATIAWLRHLESSVDGFAVEPTEPTSPVAASGSEPLSPDSQD